MPRRRSSEKPASRRRSSALDVELDRPPEPPAPRRRLRTLLRLLFVFTIFGGVALAIGSFFIRNEVIRRVNDRSVSSSSVVMSGPFQLIRGMNVEKSGLLDRLLRLGYRIDTEAIPSEPGRYRTEKGRLLIHLRGGTFSRNVTQRPLVAEIITGPTGTVSEISDVKFKKPLQSVFLEPETLSYLGDTATRASTPKSLKEFPKVLIDAVLSIEDERFYSHWGIDPVAVIRAVVINLQSGSVRQGGSTLTQQLAKNLFFSSERSLARKGFEAVAAILMETAFTKDHILELYLNEVFLGQEGNTAIHGFGEAALSFFGKDVSDLSLAEAATLAGIIKAPSSLSPRNHPDKARERREIVLLKMEERGVISNKDRTQADKEDLKVRPAERTKRIAPYFVDYVRGEVQRQLDLSSLGDSNLRILTTLDLEYQKCADDAIAAGLKQLETAYPRLKKASQPVQAAMIAVTPIRGEVLAWVGGRDYSQNQFDRVSLAKRQPGSTFKPFVYLTALDKELNNYRVARTTTTLMDEPTTIPVPGSVPWSPKNYDNRYRGEVTVREALTHSLNVPTVELAMKVGIDSIASTAARFGFGRDLPRVPSLALGAGEITPLEMARAYAALANGGVLLELVPIAAVKEQTEDTFVLQPHPQEERAASESAVFVLNTILRNVVDRGTAASNRRAGFTAPAAGKTGTSNDARDAWFVGFTPRLLAAVWVGFDDNRELKLTGGQAAAPIWAEFMKCVSPMEPELDFVPPPGVVFREVDLSTGLLATPSCPRDLTTTEVFVEGTEPVTECTRHGSSYDSYDEEYLEDNQPSSAERGRPPVQNGLPPARRSPPRRGFWDRVLDW